MSDPYAVDASFYDLVHADAPGEDVGLWLSFAGRTVRPVLEVGAGTGRIALELAAAGATVTALDPSAAMVERGRAAAIARDVDIDWREGTALSAELEPEHYGLVVLPADVFLYCEDGEEQIATLAALRDALAFDGLLAVDVPGPGLWLNDAANGQPFHVFGGQTEDGDHLDVWHLAQDDLAEQVRDLRVLYDRTDASGVVHRSVGEHRLRYVYRFELEYLLHLAGFTDIETYGGYDLEPLENASDRMIAIARRADQ